jgi:putative transcriptional regulator
MAKKAKSANPKMSPARKANPRLTRELLETANDMHASGLLSDVVRDKITLRHLGPADVTTTIELSGPEIKALREHAQLSQAVFASYLKLTVGYVSKLERGTERPSGPTLVLLDVIRRKGLEAIL